MIANSPKRELAGWRVIPIAISRVKEAAKRENISANDYVEKIILEATEGIETPEEKEERLKGNAAFLDSFAGTWSGNETTDEIMEHIKNNLAAKNIIEL